MKKLLLVLIPLLATACATAQPMPTSTSVPPSSTHITPTSTAQPPTDTPFPPPTEPAISPIMVTTWDEIVGTWYEATIDNDGIAALKIHSSGLIQMGTSAMSGKIEDGLLYVY